MKTTTQYAHVHAAPFRRAGLLTGITFAALVGTFAAPVASAGLANDIKAKVNNINTLTGRVNSRTAALVTTANDQVQRLEEVGATVNSVIAETDLIKQALTPMESVRELKRRFEELQFDPMEMLQSEEFEYAIKKIKQRRQEAQERLNDPDIESFRSEFLDLIAKLRGVLNPDVISNASTQASPLESIVRDAPRSVIALLKNATQKVFEPLANNVIALAQIQADLRTLGVREDDADGGFEFDNIRCNLYALNAERIYRKALRATKRVNSMKYNLSAIEMLIPEDEDEVEVKIWGWVGVQADITEPLSLAVKALNLKAEILGDRYELDRELAEHYSTAQGCNESAYGTYDTRLSDFLESRGY